MIGPWNVPALLHDMPDPALLQRTLKQRLQEAYTAEADTRGQVHLPEQTFDLQRRLAATAEALKAYGRAFAEATKLVGQLQEEELVLAVGEQDGIPLDALTVPDREGDIRISVDAPALYDIDTLQLLAVLRATVMDKVHAEQMVGEEAVDFAITETVNTVLAWGKFEPQVSKVKAWGASLARDGKDEHAATVRGAITKRHPYRGVKFERKVPK